MPARPIIEVAGSTDVGRVRTNNEDSYRFSAEGNDFWAVVADGCGGEAAGEVASGLAVETFSAEVSKNRTSARDLAFILRDAVLEANRRIVYEQKHGEGKKGMGTTFTGFFLRGRQGIVLHAGDSRLYARSNGSLKLVTEDHTWVQEQINAGKLTPAEAATHPRASWLLRALGMDDFKAPDIEFIPLAEGDVYMLCSDGLLRCVTEDEIAQALTDAPAVVCESLIKLALERGAPDNVTVIVLKVKGFEEVA